MSNVLLCKGAYATNPYYAADDSSNIYCIEELCYYISTRAYLLDFGFVSDKLVDWIDKELKLPDIAKRIAGVMGGDDALTRLVGVLSDTVDYFTEAQWDSLRLQVSKNNRLDPLERRKHRADSFIREGRLASALDEYEALLRDVPVDNIRFRAALLHNLGVCAAKLFMLERAAEYFRQSYETYANNDSFMCMLAAMKLYMSNRDYLNYLSMHRETYEDSLDIERKIDILSEQWQSHPTKRFLGEIAGKQQSPDYYDGINALAKDIKDRYREAVFKGRV